MNAARRLQRMDRDPRGPPARQPEPTRDQFAAECGLIRPLQLDLEGLGVAGTQGRLFSQLFVVIGRNPAADLVLDHPKVAPWRSTFR